MKWTQSCWRVCGVAFLSALAIAASPSARATNVEIFFTGMNLVYDGTSIYDAGSLAGGNGNPAEADPLVTATFVANGSVVGVVASDISLDLYIPDVTDIPSAANTHHVMTTPGNPGFLDLLIGTSPLASEFLMLDLSEVSITYFDQDDMVQFVFGAAVADSASQNLPFGLMAGDPISVSFSAQVTPGSLTEAGGIVTGFLASGSGEIRAVPEPTTVGLGVLALAGAGLVWRRRS